jgi:outer membrane protein TolC
MIKYLKIAATFALSAVACSSPVFALDLVADFQLAVANDPTFQTAIADRNANLASANQSFASYLPTATYNNQRMQTDTTNRETITVTQPIIAVDRFSAFRQGTPRKGFAEATFLMKQQDLATRLLKSANAIILANENIKLNDAKIKSLEQQSLAANRKLQLGQGTVTDLRDIEVKAAQAKSQQVAYKTQLVIASKSYAAIIGKTPNVAEFVLPVIHRPVPVRSVDDYINAAFQDGPSIQAAKFSERVSELEVQRATGVMLPTVSAINQSSKNAGATVSYSGIVVNVPIQADSYFSRQGASANYEKAKETRRETEEKARVEVERLRSLVETGNESILIQRDAIASAELSVEANIKSYEGGVRSAVDVLNATQTVFQVKSDYVTAVTSQAENMLNLLTLTTSAPADALTDVYRYLFAR